MDQDKLQELIELSKSKKKPLIIASQIPKSPKNTFIPYMTTEEEQELRSIIHIIKTAKNEES